MHIILSLERENKSIKLLKEAIPCHSNVSKILLDLAKVEDNNNKNELAIYCKFLSEQMQMINTSCIKRAYPENSFTVACGLQLHCNSTSQYESIRRRLPLILLPDKRTLFDVNSKATMPLIAFSAKVKHCLTVKF